jgi:hypothetical protein
VQEASLATLKGTVLSKILSGMNKTSSGASKATLAKRVCNTLAKREKANVAAPPKPARVAPKAKAAPKASTASKKKAKKPWDVSDDEEEYSGDSNDSRGYSDDSEVEEVWMSCCFVPLFLKSSRTFWVRSCAQRRRRRHPRYP